MDNQASEMLLLFVNGITNYFTVKKLCMFYKISTWRPRVDLDNKLVLLHSKTAIWICLYYLTFFFISQNLFLHFPKKKRTPSLIFNLFCNYKLWWFMLRWSNKKPAKKSFPIFGCKCGMSFGDTQVLIIFRWIQSLTLVFQVGNHASLPLS